MNSYLIKQNCQVLHLILLVFHWFLLFHFLYPWFLYLIQLDRDGSNRNFLNTILFSLNFPFFFRFRVSLVCVLCVYEEYFLFFFIFFAFGEQKYFQRLLKNQVYWMLSFSWTWCFSGFTPYSDAIFKIIVLQRHSLGKLSKDFPI